MNKQTVFAFLFLTTLLLTTLSGTAMAMPTAMTEDATPSGSTTGDSKAASINVRVSPLGLLIGYFNVDVDFKIGDQWTIGPTLSYWSFDTGSDSVFRTGRVESKSIGARANWYQKGVFQDSLYFSPVLQFISATFTGTSRSSGASISSSASLPVASALVGYHWFGKSFNTSLGAGLGFGLGTSKVKATDGTNTVESDISRNVGFALDFMVGIVF